MNAKRKVDNDMPAIAGHVRGGSEAAIPGAASDGEADKNKKPRVSSPALPSTPSVDDVDRRVRPAAAAAAVAPAAVVSVIIPAHNAMPWLEECFESIASQTVLRSTGDDTLCRPGSTAGGGSGAPGSGSSSSSCCGTVGNCSQGGVLEVSVYDDASTDGTAAAIARWQETFAKAGVRLVASCSADWSAREGRGGSGGGCASSVGGSGGTAAPPRTQLPLPPSQVTISATAAATAAAAPAAASGTTAATPEEHQQQPVGAGLAKNRAVQQSTGKWLCFLDADDTMMPRRIAAQLRRIREHHSDAAPVLVGCGFRREPADATRHYTEWCNSLTREQLMLHQFREITVIQPTWFMSRSTFDRVGGYVVQAPGAAHPLPSDLIFFHQLLDLPGAVVDHVPEPLVMYRYLPTSVSWRIPRKVIQRVKLRAFERRVLRPWQRRQRPEGAQTTGERPGASSSSSGAGGGGNADGTADGESNSASIAATCGDASAEAAAAPPGQGPVSWAQFTVWGAGRDGKDFVNQLLPEYRQQVRCFCDVDPAKIARGYHNPRPNDGGPPIKLPVVHFTEAVPPVVICVAMGRTGGALEQNIRSRGWREGVDFWHFS